MERGGWLRDDNSTKSELSHVQSTTWETSSYGHPDPGSRNQNHPVKKPQKPLTKEDEDTEDAGSSLAESVRIESSSGSDLDSSEEGEGLNCQGPHRKNSHSSHGWILTRLDSTSKRCPISGLHAGSEPDIWYLQSTRLGMGNTYRNRAAPIPTGPPFQAQVGL